MVDDRPVEKRPVKTIHHHQVRQLEGPDIRPGDLTPEGVVLSVEVGVQRTLVRTVGTPFYVDQGERVGVFAKIEPDMLEAIREALHAEWVERNNRENNEADRVPDPPDPRYFEWQDSMERTWAAERAAREAGQ